MNRTRAKVTHMSPRTRPGTRHRSYKRGRRERDKTTVGTLMNVQ